LDPGARGISQAKHLEAQIQTSIETS
jgi:hypothetical protein